VNRKNEVVSMTKLYLAALLVAPVIGAACHGDSAVDSHTQASQPLISAVPPGVVQPAIQQEPIAPDGSITFSVRVLANHVAVSAYQGKVTFAPGAFELISVDTPPSAGGEGHFVNAEQFHEGLIRFAAFTPTTFHESTSGDGVEALRLTVRPLRPVDDADLVAELDVVSGETGVSVQANRVLTSSGIVSAGPPSR
jgi:hypothetical protein